MAACKQRAYRVKQLGFIEINTKVLTIKSSNVSHRDFTVTPHRWNCWVDRLSFETTERYAEISSIYTFECQSAFVHIQNDPKMVGHCEVFTVWQNGVFYRRYIFFIVIKFVSHNVPSPTIFIVPHERLVPRTMKGRFLGRDTHNCVRATLSCRPSQFPDMKASVVAFLASYTVRALSHRMSVKSERIFIFNKNVHRAIVRIPRVFDLVLFRRRRPVQQYV